MTEHANQCPSWCDQTHRTGPHAVHYHEVGRVTVRDHVLRVKVFGVSDTGNMSVTVVGENLYMDIDRHDTADASRIFEVLGFPFLGELVVAAGKIVRDTEAEAVKA